MTKQKEQTKRELRGKASILLDELPKCNSDLERDYIIANMNKISAELELLNIEAKMEENNIYTQSP